MGVEATLRDKTIVWFDCDETDGLLYDAKGGVITMEDEGSLLYRSYWASGYGYGVQDLSDGYFWDAGKKINLPLRNWSLVVFADFVPFGASYTVPYIGKWDHATDPALSGELTVAYLTNPATPQIRVILGNVVDWDTYDYTITPVSYPTHFILRYYYADNRIEVQHHLDIPNRYRKSQKIADIATPAQNKDWPLSFLSFGSDGFGTGGWETNLMQFALFDGTLTAAEGEFIYNSGNGIVWGDIGEPAVVEEECEKAIECVEPDIYSYESLDATQDDGSCGKEIECCVPDIYTYTTPSTADSRHKNYLGKVTEGGEECPDTLVVLATPRQGSCIAYPTKVRLYTQNSDASIYYTTDGSDPATAITGSTQEYSGPLTINNPAAVIKARAVVDGCQDYEVTTFTWRQCISFVWDWLCSTDDKVGLWNQWAPNGDNDHNWNLDIIYGVPFIIIKRIEMYLLDQNGEWTTGQAWATDMPIYPHDDDPEEEFAPLPLQVWEGGAALNSAYKERLWFHFPDNNAITNEEAFNLWTLNAVSVNADQEANPRDSTVNADEIVDNATSTTHSVSQTFSGTDNADARFIVFAKKNTLKWICMAIRPKSGSGETVYGYFDLYAGDEGTVVGDANTIMEYFGDGWYKCELITNLKSGGTTPLASIYVAESEGVLSYSGSSQSVYLWHASVTETSETVGRKTWTLYGDIFQGSASNQFFHIKVVTDEYGVIEKFLPADNCVVTPPTCDDVSLTLDNPQCSDGQFDLDVTINNPYPNPIDIQIFRTSFCIDEIPVVFYDGTAASGGTTLTDTDLAQHCLVQYEGYWQDSVSGCQGSTGYFGYTTLGKPIAENVHFLVDGAPYTQTGVVAKTDSTITILGTTLYHDANHVGCGPTIPVTSDIDGSIGTLTPNVENAVLVLPPGTLSIGTHNICITACNSCGTTQACATLNVESVPAVCTTPSGISELLVEGMNGELQLFDVCICAPGGMDKPGWDGRLREPQAFACAWGSIGLVHAKCTDNIYIAFGAAVRWYQNIGVPNAYGTPGNTYDGDAFVLWYQSDPGCPVTTYWIGIKTTGSTPAGVYQREDQVCLGPTSCHISNSTIPPTMTVSIVS